MPMSASEHDSKPNGAVVSVQHEDFDAGLEMAALARADLGVGAVASFIGRVRAGTASAPIAAIELEHFPGMTEDELMRIAAEAERRFRLSAVRIIHRYGRLGAGAQIVFVATAAPHRQDAFDGCQFVMDFLKTTAPFWKKEYPVDGDAHWVDARDSDDEATAKWRKPGA